MLLAACSGGTDGTGGDTGTTDTGVTDTGGDSGGTDTGATDTGGTDGGTDTGADTGIDTGEDAGTDTGTDAFVCDDACDDGDTRCDGDTLETCVADEDGCFDFEATDCAASGELCLEGDDGAACFAPTCDDGTIGGNETDVDCGGDCEPCDDGLGCAVADDCVSGVCGDDSLCAAPACDDGVMNGDESDVDCGGSCDPCDDGAMCGVAEDCASETCEDEICVPAHCVDGEQNEDETDVDCGGSCLGCEVDEMCLEGADCASEACFDAVCIPAHCVDGEQNEDESDVDCGGACPACGDGGGCAGADDCISGVCGDDDLCAAPACGDGVVNGDEACDDGNDVDTDACTNACTVAVCGDAIVGPGEECDDGNDVDTDACTNACTVAVCGDAIVGPGEECDDGNDVDTDACTSACTDAVCGDTIVGPGEECDDGNDVDTDACTNACTDAVCGDAIVGPGEECDDGNDVDTDACTNACTDAVCGDTIVGPGEECDDGNDVDTDACTNACTDAVCGDAIVGPGEECDDGNDVDTDACTNACTDAVCGDAIVGPGEECDDGNDVDTDACTNACTDAVCGDTIVGPGEECDDGNDVDTDACTNACTDAVCGDGIVGPGEECDDGDDIDDNACSNSCTVPAAALCGDGERTWPFEECDDGNTEPGDGCSATCSVESNFGWTVAIGFDYFSTNDDMDRVLANAILLAPTTDAIRIVGLNYNADADEELVRTNAAITGTLDALGVDHTITVVTLAGLSTALDTADVVVVYEQEEGIASGADLTQIQDELTDFGVRGGVVIALGHFRRGGVVVNTDALLPITGPSSSGGTLTTVPDTLLSAGLSETFEGRSGTGFFTLPADSDATVAVTNASDQPIVVYRRASTCGNGIVDRGEFCDDDNRVDGDGCSASCTVDAYVCRNNSVLVVSDDFATRTSIDETALTTFFDGLGVDYTYVAQTDGSTTADIATLGRYDTVIYYNRERTITAGEETALNTYIENGGFLIVTGRDSLGSPNDAPLSRVVRSTTNGDGPFGQSTSTVADVDVPATNGAYGRVPAGATWSHDTRTDHDRATAGAGTTAVATVSGAAKILYTADIGDGGVVYYWNANGRGADGAEAFQDWTSTPIGQALFMNILDESCRGRAVHAGYDVFARDDAFDMILGNAVFGPNRTGEVNIAAFVGAGDLGREVPNTDAAIDAQATALGRTHTLTRFDDASVAALEAALVGAEVLIVYEQEGAGGPFAGSGAAWAETLQAFTAEGGIVVALGSANDGSLNVLADTGLFPADAVRSTFTSSGLWTPVDPAHPLLIGIGAPESVPNATSILAANPGFTAVLTHESGVAVATRILD